jgi:hypothetical protein
MSNFNTNALEAKIQGLSIQVGELFADIYRDQRHETAKVDNALEAYKSLRRLLPREYDGDRNSRHIGATAAHKSTQGES